jgi:hypothetical protein
MHYESAAYYKVRERESCKVVGNGLAAGRAVVAAWQLSWCGNLVGLCQRLTLEERALTSSALGGRLHGRLLIRTGVRARATRVSLTLLVPSRRCLGKSDRVQIRRRLHAK